MHSKLTKTIRNLIFISPLFYPAYLLKFQLAGIPFSALEIFCYLLFGLWFIELVQSKRSVVWDKKTRNYWYAAFLLFTGATIGVLAAPDFISLPSGEIMDAKRVALGIWKGWVLAPMLYFAVLTQVLEKREDTEKILRAFIYSAALVGLFSHFLGLFYNGVTIDLRLSGFFESANYLALYIVPAILINIYFVIKRQNPIKLKNYLDTSSLIILLYCLFFTQSYAGIIAVFGALGLAALYYVFRNPKNRKKIIIAILILIALFAVVVVSQINSDRKSVV
jgi:hypothetical protein